MSEVILKDHSIHEPSTAHMHPLETIPQGTQSDGVLNGHDNHDVDTSILAKCFLGLVALIIFSFVVVWGVTKGMLGALEKSDSVPSNTYVERPTLERAWPVKQIDTPLQSPTAMPVLQVDPDQPNVELREEDKAQLDNYNWAKDAKGKTIGVKVPIERAMDLTVERGLPSENLTQPEIAKPSGHTVEMGEISNSQRYMRDEDRKAEHGGGKADIGSQTDGMHSIEIRPQVSTTVTTLDKMDSDGRNLGSKRSPY